MLQQVQPSHVAVMYLIDGSKWLSVIYGRYLLHFLEPLGCVGGQTAAGSRESLKTGATASLIRIYIYLFTCVLQINLSRSTFNSENIFFLYMWNWSFQQQDIVGYLTKYREIIGEHGNLSHLFHVNISKVVLQWFLFYMLCIWCPTLHLSNKICSC